MRIAHVSDVYLPRLGGIEMQVRDLARRQRLEGHDALVITPMPAVGRDGAIIEPDPEWVERLDGGISNAAVRPLVSAMSAGHIFAEGKFDVVHVHASLVSPFGSAAAWAASHNGLPTVVTAHSLYTGLGPIPWLIDRSAGVRHWPLVWSAVSQKAAGPMRRALGARSTVSVLPNGVDTARWLTARKPRHTDAVIIASVMRLSRRKRPLPLLRMLRRLRQVVDPDIDLEVVIIGDGPLRSTMQSYLDKHGMAGWVRLPGRLERAQIREIFAATDLYVAPAELESFGIAALEARCAGLPVVASLRGGVGEFIHHGREGLLTANDADMVDALATLVGSPRLRTAISEHNRQVPASVGWPQVLARADLLYAAAAARQDSADAALAVLEAGLQPVEREGAP